MSNRTAKCHTERKLYCVSRGLCRPCYEKQLRERNPKYAERQRKNARQWALRNQDKVKAAARDRITNPEKRTRDAVTKRRALLRWHGITEELYTRMMDHQEGRCAICGKTPKRKLHIDHNHKTGEVRGLLCFRCNYGMSWFQHTPTLLEAAGAYLSDPPARRVC